MALRKGIQLCYPFSEGRLLTWKPPFLVQPKLDGERCRLLVESGSRGYNRVILLSSSEELITSVPHLNEAGLRLPQGEYDGELYVHGWTQSQIHSIVSRTTNISPNYSAVKFHIFDLVTEDPQFLRLHKLSKIPHLVDPFFRVDSKVCYTLQELYTFYDEVIYEGYEGFVVRQVDSLYLRKRSKWLMKFKPKKTDVYPIWDVVEAVSEAGHPLGMVGAFWCRDSEGTPFKVGAGHLTHPQRRVWWKEFLDTGLKNYELEVEYQTFSSKEKVPLFSRALTVIPGEGLKMIIP